MQYQILFPCAQIPFSNTDLCKPSLHLLYSDRIPLCTYTGVTAIFSVFLDIVLLYSCHSHQGIHFPFSPGSLAAFIIIFSMKLVSIWILFWCFRVSVAQLASNSLSAYANLRLLQDSPASASQCWDYRCEPAHIAKSVYLFPWFWNFNTVASHS